MRIFPLKLLPIISYFSFPFRCYHQHAANHQLLIKQRTNNKSKPSPPSPSPPSVSISLSLFLFFSFSLFLSPSPPRSPEKKTKEKSIQIINSGMLMLVNSEEISSGQTAGKVAIDRLWLIGSL